jgi:hypothetical protein
VFVNTFYAWLEEHGVIFDEVAADAPPFVARLDLNQLKVGMVDLIRAFGGTVE